MRTFVVSSEELTPSNLSASYYLGQLLRNAKTGAKRALAHKPTNFDDTRVVISRAHLGTLLEALEDSESEVKRLKAKVAKARQELK